MVDFENKLKYDVSDLRKLISLLRGPGGCPWDAEQTHESIRRNLLEEAYEAVEAIDNGNEEHLVEELGDVLLQVVFHADIAQSSGRFDLDDIADSTCRKLLRRHPHVFGSARAESGSESLAFWEDVKREEKQYDSVSDEMRSVASSLPELWRAEKIQKKASKAGFDWPDYSGAFGALRSEVQELENAIESDCGIEEELGDLLFSAVNVARFFNVDPERALERSSEKFAVRFSKIEKMALKQGRNLKDMRLDEMEELYQQAKLEEQLI
ncbi:MAG: nucleoside triphosphate pyrophosphohydrolase [Oscillospiraceae bacterium]|nr:nucleoside triphosphate pyrophosphohydrolase [Oscillospiraceae bacterium]